MNGSFKRTNCKLHYTRLHTKLLIKHVHVMISDCSDYCKCASSNLLVFCPLFIMLKSLMIFLTKYWDLIRRFFIQVHILEALHFYIDPSIKYCQT